MKQANIFYAGCGDVRLELMDGKSIICPIVDAGQHLQGYEYIVCPEQLQYFTTMEADTLFVRLFDELPVNALLEVSVLDLDYIFDIWKSAEWNESTLRNPDSDARRAFTREGANKQVISSQADSLIKISRIWADFFPANTSNQPI